MSQQWGTLTLDSGLCTPDHTPSSGQLWEVNSAIIPVFLKLGNGNPLQYSCLENPMDGGAWWATVYGVAKSWTQLSDLTFHLFFQLKTQNSEIFFSLRVMTQILQLVRRNQGSNPGLPGSKPRAPKC